MPTRILGISAYYHDSAACLVVDGEIVAAAQEERFTRRKYDPRFPAHAVQYCLREQNIGVRDLDFVAFYEKPLVKFDRLLETYLSYAPRGLRSYLMAMPLWLGEKLWLGDTIRAELGYEGRVLFGAHHESHAASAFYPSPFEEAAILTMDGVGEWATSSVGRGRGNEIELVHETRFPHSLGLLYSAFTHFAGFKVNSGEYKLMGLAPYGEPRFVSTIKDHLVQIGDEGSVWMNMEYFDYPHGLAMTGRGFERLFGGPPRTPESPITQREMDLARSAQEITEDVMVRMARFARRVTGLRHLCLAGGVALNCVGNARILRERLFDEIWIQPAAGDAGGAVGVALNIWHRYLDQPRVSAERLGTWTRGEGRGDRGQHVSFAGGAEPIPPYADGMKGALLGPAFSDEEIGAWLDAHRYAARRLDRACRARHVAELVAGGQVVGLLQGRMEFGPRALGARSIIADPRSPKMQALLNRKIKFRESFRPFAPAILREHVSDWFDLDTDSPYMMLVADVVPRRRVPAPESVKDPIGIERLNVPRSEIPAVTHVDYSARVQTVRRATNPLLYDIIREFHQLTGCPVIVNTSFNVRGEPIVCTPDDAYRCFMRTEMDALVLESFVLRKPEQPKGVDTSEWRHEFVLD